MIGDARVSGRRPICEVSSKMDGAMRKHAYFASRDIKGWPRPQDIAHYFLVPPGRRWFSETGNDTAGFVAEGVDETGHLALGKGRIDIELDLWGNDKVGVLLIWSKWGGPYKEMYSSKGDLARLRDFVRTVHGDLRPIGLFIPFEAAWRAVKEFLETEGALPKCIEWIANRDLPPNTFPDP
jgi:hypothetical protein